MYAKRVIPQHNPRAAFYGGYTLNDPTCPSGAAAAPSNRATLVGTGVAGAGLSPSTTAGAATSGAAATSTMGSGSAATGTGTSSNSNSSAIEPTSGFQLTALPTDSKTSSGQGPSTNTAAPTEIHSNDGDKSTPKALALLGMVAGIFGALMM